MGPLENLASSLNLALGLLLAPLPPHDLGRPQKTAHRGGCIYATIFLARGKSPKQTVSCAFGITSISLRYFESLQSYMPQPAGDGVVIADIGISLSEKTAINYLFESLWDFRICENNSTVD